MSRKVRLGALAIILGVPAGIYLVLADPRTHQLLYILAILIAQGSGFILLIIGLIKGGSDAR